MPLAPPEQEPELRLRGKGARKGEGAQCQYPKHDLIFRSVYPRDDIARSLPRTVPSVFCPAAAAAMVGPKRRGEGNFDSATETSDILQ